MNFPAPFSGRQIDYAKKCLGAWFNVAEGGKRGSKNVLQTQIFCRMLEDHPNKIHLIAGVSSATAKLNILDCDGYGLLNYFEGRNRKGKYQGRECVYVMTKTGEKVILVSGGGKDGDEKLIKGNTYGMAYITEANECHQKFIQEVFDRTLSSANRKVFHDLNPKEPAHWYYTDIIEFHDKQQENDPEYGYNYGHFTIADNMSLSDEQIKAVLKTYRKDTVWYERDIRGLRVVAEGIIFRYFAEHTEDYLFDEEELYENGRLKEPFSHIFMGIDFGGNGSKTTFVLTGFQDGFKRLLPLEADGLPVTEDIDSKAICDKFVSFYRMCLDKYGYVEYVFPDSASTTLINSLRSAAKDADLKWNNITGVTKNEIADRPRLVDLLFVTGRMKINKRLDALIMAIKSLRWDEKKPNIPEDKNIGNCNDWWDALCYTFLDFIQYIELNR